MAAPALPIDSDLYRLMKKLGFMDANGGLKSLLGQSGAFAAHPLVLDSQAIAAGVGNGADATDDTLFSKSIPANMLDATTKGLLIVAGGTLAANGNDKRVKIILGTTALFNTGTITTNGKNWQLVVLILRLASNVQLCIGAFMADATSPVVKLVTNGAEDLTTTLTLKLTGASLTSSTASDVVGNMMVTQMINI